MVSKLKDLRKLGPGEGNLTPVYAREQMEHPVPKFELAEHELSPATAYNLVHDELMLDGNARLNLATFVSPRLSS